MKKIYFALALVLGILAGCYNQAESSKQVNSNFSVETLFTNGNCTVYRFIDSGHKYYTDCKGSASWRESCGKSCTREVEVTGGKHE